jgi:uncharacterized protein YuzE
MNVSSFQETDTLHIEFQASNITGSKDLDESTVLDVDAKGNICAITVEHASQRTDISHLLDDHIATPAKTSSMFLLGE